MSLTVHTATPMVLMTTNDDATQYAPGRPRPMTQNEMVLNRIQDMTFNLTSLRTGVLSQFMDPRRDVNKECGYPETTNYAAREYQDLFDREPIANRAVSLLPKESWQVQPEVYEEEESDEPTEFERAWDDIGRALRGGSKYQDEEGNPVWDYLMRADILSGVGAFGVILLGFDDVKVAGGKSLRDPVELLTEDEMAVEEPVEGEGEDGPTDEDRMAGAFGEDDEEEEPLPEADEEEEDDFTKNAFCPTGEGGGQDNSCSSKEGGANWDNPTRDQLDRSHVVFQRIETGTASKLMDRQMRGGVLKDGDFTEFTPSQKLSNLKKLEMAIDEIRAKDPEAFEASRRWNLADEFGVKSYDDIPDKVTVYRGHDLDEKLSSHVNVTHDPKIAEEFGKRGVVTSYEINKKDIDWNMNESVFNEGELLIFGTKGKLRQKDVKESDSAKLIKKLRDVKVGQTILSKEHGPGEVVGKGVGTSLIVKFPNFTDYGLSGEDIVFNGYLSSNAFGDEPDEEDEVDDPTDPYEEESEDVEDDPNAGLEQDEMGIGEGTDEAAAPKFEAKVKLKYLRVFSEALVKVSVSEADPASPRFGQPVIYQIQLNDPTQQQAGIGLSMGTVDVHWTRIIHLAEHLVNSEVYAASRMQVVLNRLLDLRKMYGASGEGYWKQAFATMVLETDPALGGDVNVNRANIRDEMEKLENGLTRSMLLNGMSAKTLPPSVTDPTPYLTKHIEAICVYLGCPVRVFLGSERGELASSQDDAAWNDRLKFRQQYYLTPRVIVPFVDRLIKAGTLPLPKGFSVRWPDLTSSTDSEKATVANTKTTAMAAYISGGVEALIPPLEYLTKILGMDEEEAQGILDSATKLNEEQMAEQQMMAEEQGFVPDPTDPTGKAMIDPDQQEMENEIELAKAENPAGVQQGGGGGGKPPFGGKPKPSGLPPKKPGGGKSPFVKNEEEIVDLVVAT